MVMLPSCFLSFHSIASYVLLSLAIQAIQCSIEPKVWIESVIGDDDTWKSKKVSDLSEDEKNEIFREFDKGFVVMNAIAIKINCNAPYPVQWEIDFSDEDELSTLTFYDFETYTMRNGSAEKSSPESWSYTAVLSLRFLIPESTRNYTCKAINGKQGMEKSVFLLVSGHYLQGLFRKSGKSFNISTSDVSTVQAPCGLTEIDEDIEVRLYKEEMDPINGTDTWTPIPSNSSIMYDPTDGLTFKVADLPGLNGKYKCMVSPNNNEDDVVYFSIISDKISSEPKEDLTPRIKLSGSAAMWQESRHRTSFDYICCSDSEKPPELTAISCSSPADCEMVKKLIFENKKKRAELEALIRRYSHHEGPTPNCSRSNVYSPPFLVMCIGSGVDVFQQYFYSFKDTNDSTHDLGEFPFINLQDIHLISASNKFIINYEDMIKIVYFKSRKMVSGGETFEVTDTDGYTGNDFMYTGTRVTFRCYYSPFVFAIGGYWIIKWKKGATRSLIVDGTSWSDVYYYMPSSPATSLTIELEKEMESVACVCPLLNDTTWKSKEQKFVVRDPVAPKISNPQPQEVYWTVNSTDVKLKCEVSGHPNSTIMWEKDGKELSNQSNPLVISDHENVSTLKIFHVTHEDHGQYYCIASNLAGNSMKLFYVFIEEPSMSSALVVLVVIMISASIFAAAYVVWKNGALNIRMREIQSRWRSPQPQI